MLGMSDRILVMRNSKLVAEFSRAEATQQNVGAAMMSDAIAANGGTAPGTGAA